MTDVDGVEHSRVYQYHQTPEGRAVDECFEDCVCGTGTRQLPPDTEPN